MTLFGGLIDSKLVDPSLSPRRLCAFGGAVIVHGGILFGLATTSHLRVEPPVEPALDLRLFVEPPSSPPPLPAPPPPGAGDRRIEAEEPEVAPAQIPDVVQPRDLPPDPRRDGGPGEGGVEGGIGKGEPGGIPGGVPGGIPWGVPGGVLGGVLGGASAGVLGGLPGQDQAIYLTGDVRPPEKTTHVAPLYPEVARRARAQGTVILEITVGREGDVEDVEVLGSSPLFDAAAIEAVKRWKYRPALQAGRSVKVYLTVRVEFRLR